MQRYPVSKKGFLIAAKRLPSIVIDFAKMLKGANMLVSHSKKFIFIKTFKTAGTSTEMALQPYCMPQEMTVTEATSEIVTDFGIVGARGANISDQNWRNHMNAKEIKDKLPDEVWDQYTKICNIRNPWDAYVSFFHFTFPKIKNSSPNFFIAEFRKWVLKNNGKWGLPNYLIDGEPVLDEYIRYDCLQNDFNALCEKLDLDKTILPKTKHTQRGEVIPYQEYYDDAGRARVAEIRSMEINRFGWTFD